MVAKYDFISIQNITLVEMITALCNHEKAHLLRGHNCMESCLAIELEADEYAAESSAVAYVMKLIIKVTLLSYQSRPLSIHDIKARLTTLTHIQQCC